MTGNQPAFGLYLRSRNPSNLGLTWKVSAAGSMGKATITRSAVLASTEAGHGVASLVTSSASAEVGYGFELGQIQLTPFTRLATVSTTREAYSEASDVSFPATFNSYKQSEMTITLGVSGRGKIGKNKNRIRFFRV